MFAYGTIPILLQSVKRMDGWVQKMAIFPAVNYYIYADMDGWVGQKKSINMPWYFRDGPYALEG